MATTNEPAGGAEAGRRAALGRYGEELAARLLAARGMQVLDRNWRCDAGELDLVLRDGDDLVVAEVKTRTSDACGTPHEAVGAEKLARLRRLAARWLADHDARPRGVRVDLVAVLRPPRGASTDGARAGDRLMPVATARAVSLRGSMGHLVDVQADVSPGLVGTTLVGRADSSLQEARDRVRMAVANTEGVDWPATRRVTVLLSPADLPKAGTGFDLAIACAVLAAARELPAAALEGTVLIGELTLGGSLRPAAGVLPMVMAAADRGLRRVILPEPQAAEAAMVPGLDVLGLRSLGQVVAELRGDPLPEAPPVAGEPARPLLSWRGQDRVEEVDLADLVGVREARYAAEVAAAGGHHLMLSGPRGSGKTSLAERIPGLLPDLTTEEALELTAVHSLAGVLRPGDGLVRRPPLAAPHHSASRTSVLGGGTGVVRPGQVSRAHGGVLLLDEFPLFRADVIEALREPLESGEITLARGEEVATFPARAMVVLAANPCPCGEWHARAGRNDCTCSEVARREYRRKISAPLTDRIDVVRHLEPAGRGDADPLCPPEASAVVAARVAEARARQGERYAGCHWRVNAHAPAAALAERWPLPVPARRLVEEEVVTGRLTRRGGARVHRLAWTVSDLHGSAQPGLAEVEVAIALRQGQALPAAVLDTGPAAGCEPGERPALSTRPPGRVGAGR